MNDKQIKLWKQEKLAERVSEAMRKRGFGVFYAKNGEEAKKKILEMLPNGSTIALAGSQTMEQIGIVSELRKTRASDFIDPFGHSNFNQEEKTLLRKKMLTADILITSSNAVDETGILYNIDGIGNRVAAMIYGPDKVILAVSLNKIVKDAAEAWRRISDVASPMNNKRLKIANPCAETGFCHDCKGETRICNYYTKIKYSLPKERIWVVLIAEDFGY